jgi:uncharacterized membrane protein YdfJ with MMPL/SSD domain
MAVSSAILRLLRVLTLEEEQCERSLAVARGRLERLEQALAAVAARDRGGRRLIAASAGQGDTTDRLAGIEEARAAARGAEALAPWMREAEQEVAALREAYLAKRVERRQAETLVREAEAAQTLAAARRSQQALDDWYLNRRSGKAAERPAQPSTKWKVDSF